MDKIYHHVIKNRKFLVIPNWEGTEQEYFHILESTENEEGYYYDECITGFQNEHNINTLLDAKDFIINYIRKK